MEFREFAESLEWNDFSTYPKQGSNVYIRLVEQKTGATRHTKIRRFNAVSFSVTDCLPAELRCFKWNVRWIPAVRVDGCRNEDGSYSKPGIKK